VIDHPNHDTAEMFYRAQVMAMGAQLSAGGISAEAAAAMEEVDAIAEAERERQREIVRVIRNFMMRGF
jgi:hypothetical protein